MRTSPLRMLKPTAFWSSTAALGNHPAESINGSHRKVCCTQLRESCHAWQPREFDRWRQGCTDQTCKFRNVCCVFLLHLVVLDVVSFLLLVDGSLGLPPKSSTSATLPLLALAGAGSRASLIFLKAGDVPKLRHRHNDRERL